jgi:(E)-4-hydroxy-3-methylbut-2-enyl-diphosphate synthase
VVNGPGEAREADIGIAGGDGVGILFRKGRVVKKFPEERLVAALLDEVASVEKRLALDAKRSKGKKLAPR